MNRDLTQNEPLNGLLPINKPKGLTSFDVIRQIKSLIGQKAIGHTGTLDPIAQGLLLLCLGKATKISAYLTNLDKEYIAEITLGAFTDTYDAEGEKTIITSQPQVTHDEVKQVLKRFLGRIAQTPPPFSAIKHKGKPLYCYARKGIPVNVKPRKVTIYSLELVEFNLPRIIIKAKVSSGTYIRSLAHSIGQILACGAYMSELVRISIGRFKLAEAVTLGEIKEDSRLISARLVPPRQALYFLPWLKIRPAGERKACSGQTLPLRYFEPIKNKLTPGETVAVVNETDEVICLSKLKMDRDENWWVVPLKVLSPH